MDARTHGGSRSEWSGAAPLEIKRTAGAQTKGASFVYGTISSQARPLGHVGGELWSRARGAQSGWEFYRGLDIKKGDVQGSLRFRVGDLPPQQEWRLAIHAEGFESWAREVECGQEVRVELESLLAPSKFHLQVVDPDGLAVRDYSYSVRVHSAGKAVKGLDRSTHLAVQREAREVQSSDGRAEFLLWLDLEERPFVVEVLVQAPGFAQQERPFFWDGGPTEIEVCVTRGRWLRGRVLGVDGPLIGAQVHALDVRGRGLLACRSRHPDGDFELPAFDWADAGDLWANAPGHAPARLARADWHADPEHVLFVLDRGATLRGRLLDAEQRALAGHGVRVLVDGPGGDRGQIQIGAVVDRTDASGGFRLTGIPPGTWPVESFTGHDPLLTTRSLGEFRFESGESVQDFIQPTGVRLTGSARFAPGVGEGLVFLQVLAANERPLPQAPEAGGPGRVLARYSGEPGDFVIEGVPEGPCWVRLLSGTGAVMERFVLAQGKTTSVPAFEFESAADYNAWVKLAEAPR